MWRMRVRGFRSKTHQVLWTIFLGGADAATVTNWQEWCREDQPGRDGWRSRRGLAIQVDGSQQRPDFPGRVAAIN
jgi:hypothetical protein